MVSLLVMLLLTITLEYFTVTPEVSFSSFQQHMLSTGEVRGWEGERRREGGDGEEGVGRDKRGGGREGGGMRRGGGQGEGGEWPRIVLAIIFSGVHVGSK